MQAMRMKQEGKRVTTKVSMSNFSIEDYHGEASLAIPFDWESEPGTPKINHYTETLLPPLTPPPSYFSSLSTPKRPIKNTSFSKPNILFNTPFPNAARDATTLPSSSPVSPFWLRSFSVSSTSMTRPTKSFGSRVVSVLCFGGGANSKRKCGYSSLFKVLLRNAE